MPLAATSKRRQRLPGTLLPPCGALAATLVAAGAARAAEVFVQPSGYVETETNSNLDLTPGGQSEVTGYLADLASVIGIATPNSATTIRPRVDYRNYPEDAGDNRLEAYLDFNSFYKAERSSASIGGTLEHRDLASAELNSATYDPINPNQPTSPQTGHIVNGATRDSAYIVPNYSYNLTPLLSLGVEGVYQKVNFKPNDDGRFVDFEYGQGKAYLIWTLNQKFDINFGAYANKYNATRYDSKATAEGGLVGLNTSWTPLFSTRASVVLQHSEINSGIPPVFDASVNTWGGDFTAIYKAQTQQFRADLSRLISPSGGGGVYVNNQLQFEYDRRMSQRWSLTAAAILLRGIDATQQTTGNGRDYVRTLLETKWMITQTWFILGGYQYISQKYETDPDGAANNRFYLRFGYQGLNRQW
jgi:hypothetical protein